MENNSLVWCPKKILEIALIYLNKLVKRVKDIERKNSWNKSYKFLDDLETIFTVLGICAVKLPIMRNILRRIVKNVKRYVYSYLDNMAIIYENEIELKSFYEADDICRYIEKLFTINNHPLYKESNASFVEDKLVFLNCLKSFENQNHNNHTATAAAAAADAAADAVEDEFDSALSLLSRAASCCDNHLRYPLHPIVHRHHHHSQNCCSSDSSECQISSYTVIKNIEEAVPRFSKNLAWIKRKDFEFKYSSLMMIPLQDRHLAIIDHAALNVHKRKIGGGSYKNNSRLAYQVIKNPFELFDLRNKDKLMENFTVDVIDNSIRTSLFAPTDVIVGEDDFSTTATTINSEIVNNFASVSTCDSSSSSSSSSNRRKVITLRVKIASAAAVTANNDDDSITATAAGLRHNYEEKNLSSRGFSVFILNPRNFNELVFNLKALSILFKGDSSYPIVSRDLYVESVTDSRFKIWNFIMIWIIYDRLVAAAAAASSNLSSPIKLFDNQSMEKLILQDAMFILKKGIINFCSKFKVSLCLGLNNNYKFLIYPLKHCFWSMARAIPRAMPNSSLNALRHWYGLELLRIFYHLYPVYEAREQQESCDNFENFVETEGYDSAPLALSWLARTESQISRAKNVLEKKIAQILRNKSTITIDNNSGNNNSSSSSSSNNSNNIVQKNSKNNNDNDDDNNDNDEKEETIIVHDNDDDDNGCNSDNNDNDDNGDDEIENIADIADAHEWIPLSSASSSLSSLNLSSLSLLSSSSLSSIKLFDETNFCQVSLGDSKRERLFKIYTMSRLTLMWQAWNLLISCKKSRSYARAQYQRYVQLLSINNNNNNNNNNNSSISSSNDNYYCYRDSNDCRNNVGNCSPLSFSSLSSLSSSSSLFLSSSSSSIIDRNNSSNITNNASIINKIDTDCVIIDDFDTCTLPFKHPIFNLFQSQFSAEAVDDDDYDDESSILQPGYTKFSTHLSDLIYILSLPIFKCIGYDGYKVNKLNDIFYYNFSTIMDLRFFLTNNFYQNTIINTIGRYMLLRKDYNYYLKMLKFDKTSELIIRTNNNIDKLEKLQHVKINAKTCRPMVICPISKSHWQKCIAPFLTQDCWKDSFFNHYASYVCHYRRYPKNFMDIVFYVASNMTTIDPDDFFIYDIVMSIYRTVTDVYDPAEFITRYNEFSSEEKRLIYEK